MFAVTLFTYSEVLSSAGFIPTFAVSYDKNGVAQIVSNFLAFTVWSLVALPTLTVRIGPLQVLTCFTKYPREYPTNWLGIPKSGPNALESEPLRHWMCLWSRRSFLAPPFPLILSTVSSPLRDLHGGGSALNQGISWKPSSQDLPGPADSTRRPLLMPSLSHHGDTGVADTHASPHPS